MTSLDWKIQKKLLDGGGTGGAVYILAARANNKLSREREMIEKLRAEGRTVVYVRPQDPKKLLGSRKPWPILDRDILTPEQYERADRMWKEYWKEKRYGREKDL